MIQDVIVFDCQTMTKSIQRMDIPEVTAPPMPEKTEMERMREQLQDQQKVIDALIGGGGND